MADDSKKSIDLVLSIAGCDGKPAGGGREDFTREAVPDEHRVHRAGRRGDAAEDDVFALSYILPLLNDITAFGHPLEVTPNVVDERMHDLNYAQLFARSDGDVVAQFAHEGKVTGLFRLVFQQVRECVTKKFGEHIAEIALGVLLPVGPETGPADAEPST